MRVLNRRQRGVGRRENGEMGRLPKRDRIWVLRISTESKMQKFLDSGTIRIRIPGMDMDHYTVASVMHGFDSVLKGASAAKLLRRLVGGIPRIERTAPPGQVEERARRQTEPTQLTHQVPQVCVCMGDLPARTPEVEGKDQRHIRDPGRLIASGYPVRQRSDAVGFVHPLAIVRDGCFH
jgi:hypothetical protein